MSTYYVFRKNFSCRPLSWKDKNGNSEAIEFSFEMAKKYVEEENRKCGEDTYFYMEEKEWLKECQSLQRAEIYEKMDEVIGKMMNYPEMKFIEKQICEENDRNIIGFEIPFKANCNRDYEEKLKDKLDEFAKTIDRSPFRKEGTLVDDVKCICKMVYDAFVAAKNEKTKKEAEKIVEKILENYKEDSFAVTELDKSYAFRGIAPFDELKPEWGSEEKYNDMIKDELNFFRARQIGEGETIQERKEINYLSYNNRKWANDMRFSSKGKVCLYLGTTSYVCSKECRWDESKNLYLSSFKFNENGKKLKILNLVVLEALMNGIGTVAEWDLRCRELHSAMIRIFPLVIATMFTISTPDAERKGKYGECCKYEYLLSQILMNVLQKVGIDGVAYLSRQGKNDFQYPQMVCLAIPVNDSSDRDQYGNLINDFVMTPPILYNNFSGDSIYERKSYINKNYSEYIEKSWGKTVQFNAKVEFAGKTVFYQETPYSKFDDFLINQEHKKVV